MIMKYVFMMIGLVAVMTACSMIGLGGDPVITSIDNVVPGAEVTAVDSSDLPIGSTPLGGNMVIADRADVIDTSDVTEVDSRGGGSDFIGAAFGLGKTFFPWLAAWEGILTLMFKRKRLHYGNAVKRVVPGSNFSLTGALNSLVAGLGMKHTNDASPPAPTASA